MESVFPALHRLRQGAARHAHGDHREQAARRSADLDQGSAGRGAAGAEDQDQQRAERLQEARVEAGPQDGFHERSCCHRAARTGTGKVGCGQVKRFSKLKSLLERTRSVSANFPAPFAVECSDA